MDATGTLDEALERLHHSGPERLGRLTNHAPMAVAALAARGQARAVHRWLDLYAGKPEDFPSRVEPVTADNWPSALGDPRRAADWTEHFERQLTERPWRELLGQWWPRLFERALAHGDEHVIKLTDTALDVGDAPALAAALRSIELSTPLG